MSEKTVSRYCPFNAFAQVYDTVVPTQVALKERIDAGG